MPAPEVRRIAAGVGVVQTVRPRRTLPSLPPLPSASPEYGAWLDGFSWDCWATLTFRYDPSPRSALTSFANWLQGPQVGRLYVLGPGETDRPSPPAWCSGRPRWFVATEDGGLNGRTHLHALISTSPADGIRRRSAWRDWFDRHGRAQLLPFDRKRGAAHYIAKYVSKELGEWDVGGEW